MKRHVALLSLAVLLTSGAAAARCSEINEKFRDEDARLQQRVTLTPRRVLLGDLFAELNKQTGVVIEEDERDQAPGVEVVAACKDLPLCSLLDAIWALLGNTDSKYRWYRDGSPANYKYTLYEPDAVKKRAARLNEYALRAYENYVNTLCDLADLTTLQRKARKSEFKRAFIDTDPQQIDIMFDNEGLWKHYALFAALVPTESRTAVLLGRQAVNVSVSETSEKIQDLFSATWKTWNTRTREPDGSLTPVPPPSSIQIFAVGPRESDILPTVMLQDSPYSRVSLISTRRTGVGLANILKKRWLLPSDSLSDKQDQVKVPAIPAEKPIISPRQPGDVEPKFDIAPGVDPAMAQAFMERVRSGQRQQSHSVEEYLKGLCRATNLSLVAVLPHGSSPSLDFQRDGIVKDYLTRLEGAGSSLMHKWRNSVLLVSFPQWFFNNSHSLPYYIVKEFPSLGSGIVELPDMAKIMGKATDADVSVLSQRYAVIRDAQIIRPGLLLAKLHPQVLTTSGFAVDEETLQYLQRAPFLETRPEIKEGRIERIRAAQIDIVRKPGVRVTLIQLEGSVGGRWIVLGGFAQRSPVQPTLE
jgi:hypothetical protein